MSAGAHAQASSGLAQATELRERPRKPIPTTLVVGAVILAICVISFIVGPFLLPYDGVTPNLQSTFAPPSLDHPLGTDNFGRDILTRILLGGRVDLMIATLATSVTFVVGTVLGAAAGYYGGWFDQVVMRVVDVMIALPFLVLIIGIIAMLGTSRNNIFIAIWLVGWIAYCRIVRGEVLVAKRLEYSEAAKVTGNSDLRIIIRHLMPNVITVAVVYAMADMVLNILFASSLSFLGLGVQPPNPEWGLMIAEGRNFFLRSWQLTTLPGLALLIVGAGFSLVGDGLADYLRPEN